MLKLSREVDLSLVLMASLARSERDVPVGLEELAKENRLPYRFISKLAVKLKKAGLLKSKEGRRGGYYLAKRADKISAKEILEAIEGPLALVHCAQGKKCTVQCSCAQKDLVTKLTDKVSQELEITKLKDLC